MNLFRTMVGIDPTGRRLALAAVRGGFGRAALCAPPLVCDLRAEREPQLLSEAEGVLGEFVARHGLAGSAARLCVPADKVYTARISFPPVREKDLRPALEMELERLFPFPPSRLRFGWRRLGKPRDGKGASLVVTAAPADYLEGWENAVSRAGLRPAGAIPVGWALAAALPLPDGMRKDAGGTLGILREAWEAVECSVLEGDVPVFSALRRCDPDGMPAAGFSLLADGLVDVRSRGEEAGVDVVAPQGWHDAETGGTAAGGPTVRFLGDFPDLPVDLAGGKGGAEDPVPARRIAGAFGAAVALDAADLSAAGTDAAASPLARTALWTLAAAALLLGLAWPSSHYIRTKSELARLDAEIAALRPVVTEVEESVADLSRVRAKISLLRGDQAGRGEPFLILKELTERLPDGTWLTGLRVDGRSVEIDGLSPSASEIFPFLTKDGRFRDVAFSSPITRQADNLERFRIGAEFVPGPGPEAQAPR
ncbi:MAG TPA: PilN domain-containing protein [Candidatus Aquicultoraceae bacterium]|nr:PilN domain-containing protein [Candidatus Aquicultoraceae bacterium]